MVYPLSPPFMKAKLSYQKYTGLVQTYCVNAFASFKILNLKNNT